METAGSNCQYIYVVISPKPDSNCKHCTSNMRRPHHMFRKYDDLTARGQKKSAIGVELNSASALGGCAINARAAAASQRPCSSAHDSRTERRPLRLNRAAPSARLNVVVVHSLSAAQFYQPRVELIAEERKRHSIDLGKT